MFLICSSSPKSSPLPIHSWLVSLLEILYFLTVKYLLLLNRSLNRDGGHSYVAWRKDLSTYSSLCMSLSDANISFSDDTTQGCVSVPIHQMESVSNLHVTLQFGSSL